MSFAIDLKEYGSGLKKAYESVVSSDPETTWAVFDYAATDNVLKPGASGPSDLDDFVDAFDDARVQYGLARVEFNSINKVVLVGWVGENVPSRQRLVFNAHMSAVAKQFPGHHVQITARSSDELTPAIILDRVSAAAGSKYASASKPAPSTKPAYITAKDGADEKDWGDAQDVEERELRASSGSGYKSSVRDELEQLRKGKKGGAEKSAPEKRTPERRAPSKATRAATPESDEEEPKDADSDEDADDRKRGGISGLDSGTSYKPVGKIDIKAIREAGKGSKFADARIEKIESSYKPIGKVDIKAIREQARKEKQLKSKNDDDVPAAPARKAVAVKKEESESEPEAEPEEKKPARSSAARNRAAGYGGGSGDDEPQLGSLSDRMKAFQASVGAAKPKFDASSRPARGSSTARVSSTSSTSTVRKVDDDKKKQVNGRDHSKDASADEEEEAPLSVAAQLARARLSSQKEESPAPPARGAARNSGSAKVNKDEDKDDVEDEDDAPKGNVSTFAARFAAKSPAIGTESKSAPATRDNDESEEEKAEEAAPPPAPRRAPAAKSEPEPEPARAGHKVTKDEEPTESGSGLTAIVQFEHEKEDDDEITLVVGELITEIQEVDENWYLGRNSGGDVGLFPAEFVEIQARGASKKASAPSSAPAASEPKSAPSESGKVAIAQYDYEAGDDDELEFSENEKITEIEFPSEDWWSGKNAKGKVGLFPASYVSLQ